MLDPMDAFLMIVLGLAGLLGAASMFLDHAYLPPIEFIVIV